MSEELLNLDPEATALEGAWAPKTLRDAEWAMECIAQSEAEIGAIEAQADDAHRRIDLRVGKLMEQAKRRVDYFRGRVAEFAQAHKADILIGTKKSRDLVSGRIGWRKKGGKLRVVDPKALAEWLPTQDASLYRVEVKPEMAELQKYAKADGVVPPGCEWEEEHDEFYLEAASLLLPIKE